MPAKVVKRYSVKELSVLLILVFILVPTGLLAFNRFQQKQKETENLNKELNQQIAKDNETIKSIQTELDRLKGEDTRKRNEQLRQEIDKLKKSFNDTVVAYEGLLDLRGKNVKVASQESLFASVLHSLSKDDLPSAQKSLDQLNKSISSEKAKLIAAGAVVIPANVPEFNQPPGSGYRRQKVTVDNASFLVDIISADLNSTKVIVDTASDSTCTNNCPVMALADYAGRSGAYAGVNGTYFCPETYPSCADKKNTFDVLVMNKKKTYFNSDNNVYSTVPVAIFSGSSARFIQQSSGWGRDTGVDAVIANRPLLVLDGNLMFGSGGEEKEILRGNRSFLGASGSTAYIGVVYGASVAQAAKVLWTMGIKSAINLDDGGSVALWSGGYKAGPGRNIPNAVLFWRK